MVDIGIVTGNCFASIRRCIESILCCTNSPFRLFVADNGSTDGTREYLVELYKQNKIYRLLLFDTNVGIAPALNSLWEFSDSTFFLKMDNAIEIKKTGWLAEMFAVARRNPEVGLLAFSFRKQLNHEGYPLVVLSGGDVVQEPDEPLKEGCILIPRKTHWILGYWSEESASDDDDAEYCQRAMLQGIKMYYVRDTDWMIHANACRSYEHCGQEHSREFSRGHQKITAAPVGLCSINKLMYNFTMKPLAMRRKFKTILSDDGMFARLELSNEYLTQGGRQVTQFKNILRCNSDYMRTP